MIAKRKPLITIGPEAPRRGARRMANNKIRKLPAMKHHKLIGTVVVSDFAKLGKKNTHRKRA